MNFNVKIRIYHRDTPPLEMNFMGYQESLYLSVVGCYRGMYLCVYINIYIFYIYNIIELYT